MALRSPGATGARSAAWAAAGLALGVALSAAAFAPVSWLAARIASATGGRVVLADAQGTIWNGDARLVLAGGTGASDAAALPGRIAWSLRPRWTGLAAQVHADCCTAEPIALLLSPRRGGAALAMADSASRWPAQVLAGLGTPWNTLQLRGDVQLATQGLSVEWIEGRLNVAGRARIDALRVASRLSTLAPLGSYRMTVNGGSTAMLQLETLEGSLKLEGSGVWVGSRLRFDGVASAAPEREAALANLLNIIGRRDGPRSSIRIG